MTEKYLRDHLADVLSRHGIEAGEKVVNELARVAEGYTWWGDEGIVAYVDTLVPASVRTWCSRNGVRRKVLARADDVIRARAAQRGQGWRKNVRASEEGSANGPP